MIIKKQSTNLERIEQQGLSSEIAKKLSRKTKANTYSGFLLSCMKKLRDSGNLDAALLTETLLFYSFYLVCYF
jgi:hypothetical protein